MFKLNNSFVNLRSSAMGEFAIDLLSFFLLHSKSENKL